MHHLYSILMLHILSFLVAFVSGDAICHEQSPIDGSEDFLTCFHSNMETCENGAFCCCLRGFEPDVGGNCVSCKSDSGANIDDPCRFREGNEIQEYILMPGFGYNIAKGSPLAGKEHGISGQMILAKPKAMEVFKSSLDDPCPQWAWKFPASDDWTFKREDGFTEATTSQAIYSAHTYQEESSTHLEESADSGVLLTEGVDIKFTASQDFKSSTSEFSSGNVVEFRVSREATAIRSSVKIQTAAVSDAYWQNLAKGIQRGNLDVFVNDFGTHIIQEILGGSRLEQITKFESSEYEVASSDSAAFSAGLTASYEGATGSVSTKNSVKKNQADIVNNHSSSSTLTIRGGNGQTDLSTDTNVSTFLNDAYNFPAPLDMTIYPADEFITMLRWDDFQKYLDMNFPTLVVSVEGFTALWKEALLGLCTTTISFDGTEKNSCIAENNPIKRQVKTVECAVEGGTCHCNGQVKYGDVADGKFTDPIQVSGSISCNNDVFGDSDVGTTKSCFCTYGERCSWESHKGSIAGSNIECFNSLPQEECKAKCEAHTDCLSIDWSHVDGRCCLNTCQIGHGCDNDNDEDYEYFACNDLYSSRCGLDWNDANNNCNEFCNVHSLGSCPHGQQCYSNLQSSCPRGYGEEAGVCVSGYVSGLAFGTQAECEAFCNDSEECSYFCFAENSSPEYDCLTYSSSCQQRTNILHGNEVYHNCYEKKESSRRRIQMNRLLSMN